MSDFLTNLAARSLGTVGVVRPRVPSLFEPTRRGGGLRPVQPGWPAARERTEELSRDRGSEARMRRLEPEQRVTQVLGEERVDRQETTPHPPTPTFLKPRRTGVPAGDVRRTEETEARAFAEVNRVEEGSSAGWTSHVSESRHGAPNVGPGTNAVAPPAVSGFAPLVKLPIVRPGAISEPGNIMRPEVVYERAAAEDAPPDTPAVRRLQRAVQPSVRTFDRPTAFAATRPARTEVGPARERAPVPFTSEAAEPDRRTSELQIQPPPIAARETMKPVAPPAIRPPTVAARETMARPVAPKAPVAAPTHPQPEPSIQVTIGRVEVRAIFPEAPAARMPAPRARPIVSLDEYLKRAR